MGSQHITDTSVINLGLIHDKHVVATRLGLYRYKFHMLRILYASFDPRSAKTNTTSDAKKEERLFL